jgi:hypothetical protein
MGLVVDGIVTPSAGSAEREAAVEMLGHVSIDGWLTLEADKGYDTGEFVRPAIRSRYRDLRRRRRIR